jgi:hypothetical protein
LNIILTHAQEQQDDSHAYLYILFVLMFYGFSIVVLMVKYIKREREGHRNQFQPYQYLSFYNLQYVWFLGALNVYKFGLWSFQLFVWYTTSVVDLDPDPNWIRIQESKNDPEK